MTSEKTTHWYKRAIERFQADFRLSLITMFCLPAAIAIGAFAIYRFIQQDWVMAAIDSILVVVSVSILVVSWTTGRTRAAGMVMVLFTGFAVLLVVHVAGVIGLFWSYVDIIASFFLAPALFSIPKVLLMTIGSIILGARAGIEPMALASFGTTAMVVALFAHSFAHRSQSQASKLEDLATRDPLTGAGNRRALEEELDIALARYDREQIGAGVLMMDLDYFKQINDQCGHGEGDDVLRQFASLIESHSRRSDRLFRFGGEEFVLLLQNVDKNGLGTAARHIHHTIRDKLSYSGGKVTCSVGGTLIQPGDDWESWLHRADQALYTAKNSGRDTIVLMAPEEASQPESQPS